MVKLRPTGGFWLLLGILLLAASARVLLWFALACLIHELGHAAAIHLVDGQVECVSLTGVGAVLVSRRERLFSYREEGIIALAGPAASFLLAAVAAAVGRRFGSGDAYLLSGLSLALAVFNLIPAGPLDGGRVLRALLFRLLGPDRGDLICRNVTGVLGAALAALGLWTMVRGGNFTLLLCAGGSWLVEDE